MTKVLLWKS